MDILGNLLVAIIMYPIIVIMAIITLYLYGIHFPSSTLSYPNYVEMGLSIAFGIATGKFTIWCIRDYRIERRYKKGLKK